MSFSFIEINKRVKRMNTRKNCSFSQKKKNLSNDFIFSIYKGCFDEKKLPLFYFYAASSDFYEEWSDDNNLFFHRF